MYVPDRRPSEKSSRQGYPVCSSGRRVGGTGVVVTLPQARGSGSGKRLAVGYFGIERYLSRTAPPGNASALRAGCLAKPPRPSTGLLEICMTDMFVNMEGNSRT